MRVSKWLNQKVDTLEREGKRKDFSEERKKERKKERKHWLRSQKKKKKKAWKKNFQKETRDGKLVNK